METRELYICKDFHDFLRFACTGDFLDEDEIPQCTKQSLSAKGALGKDLMPCFHELTMENMQ